MGDTVKRFRDVMDALSQALSKSHQLRQWATRLLPNEHLIYTDDSRVEFVRVDDLGEPKITDLGLEPFTDVGLARNALHPFAAPPQVQVLDSNLSQSLGKPLGPWILELDAIAKRLQHFSDMPAAEWFAGFRQISEAADAIGNLHDGMRAFDGTAGNAVSEPPKPSTEPPVLSKPFGPKRASVNAVVLDLFQKNPESIGWSLRKLEQATGCSRTAISESKAYTQAKLVKAEAKIGRLEKQSGYLARDGKKRSVRPDE